jgi:hypothetical protein
MTPITFETNRGFIAVVFSSLSQRSWLDKYLYSSWARALLQFSIVASTFFIEKMGPYSRAVLEGKREE